MHAQVEGRPPEPQGFFVKVNVGGCCSSQRSLLGKLCSQSVSSLEIELLFTLGKIILHFLDFKAGHQAAAELGADAKKMMIQQCYCRLQMSLSIIF
jgi:hypothetical protein